MTNEHSDEQLIKNYLNGDEAAFEFLLRRYLTAIYNFTAQYVGFGPNAEDMTQEAFIKAWKNLKKFNASKRFRPWLYKIAYNTVVDHLRRLKTTVISIDDNEDLDQLDYLSDSPDPLEQMENTEYAVTIERAMGKLSEIHRTVIHLYYREQLSLPEIAEVLKKPADTVKSRHRRALLKLRQLLAEDPRVSNNAR